MRTASAGLGWQASWLLEAMSRADDFLLLSLPAAWDAVALRRRGGMPQESWMG